MRAKWAKDVILFYANFKIASHIKKLYRLKPAVLHQFDGNGVGSGRFDDTDAEVDGYESSDVVYFPTLPGYTLDRICIFYDPASAGIDLFKARYCSWIWRMTV